MSSKGTLPQRSESHCAPDEQTSASSARQAFSDVRRLYGVAGRMRSMDRIVFFFLSGFRTQSEFRLAVNAKQQRSTHHLRGPRCALHAAPRR